MLWLNKRQMIFAHLQLSHLLEPGLLCDAQEPLKVRIWLSLISNLKIMVKLIQFVILELSYLYT